MTFVEVGMNDHPGHEDEESPVDDGYHPCELEGDDMLSTCPTGHQLDSYWHSDK